MLTNTLLSSKIRLQSLKVTFKQLEIRLNLARAAATTPSNKFNYCRTFDKFHYSTAIKINKKSQFPNPNRSDQKETTENYNLINILKNSTNSEDINLNLNIILTSEDTMSSLKINSESDLATANDHFSTVSFINNTAQPTDVDYNLYKSLSQKPFFNADDVNTMNKYPNICRWYRNIRYSKEGPTVGSSSNNTIAQQPISLSSDAVSSASNALYSINKVISEPLAGQDNQGATGDKRADKKAAKAEKKAAAEDKKTNNPQPSGPVIKKKEFEKGANIKTVDCKVVTMSKENRKLPIKKEDKPSLGLGSKESLPTPDLKKKDNTRYVTTAIHYTNGWPHVGHAYETIMGDIITRYFRLNGYDTFYQTGTDEHGQKIAESSMEEREGRKFKTPKELCDMFVGGFHALFDRTEIAHDQFIRTSDKNHYKIVQDIWRKCMKNGDIYLGEYEGWYMVREERFVTDQEAEEMKFVDPSNGNPLTKMKEPSYFFKLSKYSDWLVKKLETDKDWVKPASYRNELLTRLKEMCPLRDLSISRNTFSWGIPVPDHHPEALLPDPKTGQIPKYDKPDQHVMYVWFDALTNYYSGVNFPQHKGENSKYWPANMHVIGKDILWFHTVIWSAMLESCKLPHPKSVMVHGFVNDAKGKKMSKSENNVINPHDICDWCSPDTFRWYLARGANYGSDLPFSVQALKLQHNAELCDNLGNLVNRAVTLCKGSVPPITPTQRKEIPLPFDVEKSLKTDYCTALDDGRTGDAAELVIRAASKTNGWIAELAPWKITKVEPEKAAAMVRLLLESVYVLAHYFAPFIPRAAEAILEKLNMKGTFYSTISPNFDNLKEGATISAGSVLFEPFSSESLADESPTGFKGDLGSSSSSAGPANTSSEGASKAGAKGEGKKGKDNNKDGQAAAKPKKEKAPPAPKAPALDMEQPMYSRLDLRVGKIVAVENHPDAEKLYVEKIDVGEAEPRTIISGLRHHYTLDEMLNRQIVAICNLKPRPMLGITSHGMVLCAKQQDPNNPEKEVVQFAKVPESAKPGDHILLEGDHTKNLEEIKKPWDGKQVDKHKVWFTAAEKMRSNEEKVCCYDGKPLVCNGERLVCDYKNAVLS